MATDEQLIEQIQQGKSEAYGQLFRKYYQQIYSICFSILKNSHDAEEVTSETFVRAYLKLDQLKKPDKFFAWLKKIALNHSKKYAKQRGVEMIPLDLAFSKTAREEGMPTLVGGCLPPDKHLLRQELMDSVMEAVEALPPKYREVVRAHIDGLSHAEISEQFGISVQASMNRLYRARKKIAAHVKDLLNAIIGLPKMLSVKKIISGGMLAMKIGTSAKVTIGVIGVLVAGFIGFQIATHQPDVKPPEVVTQQQTAKSEFRQKQTPKISSRPNGRNDEQRRAESRKLLTEEDSLVIEDSQGKTLTYDSKNEADFEWESSEQNPISEEQFAPSGWTAAEEQRRQEIADAAKKEIASLVLKWHWVIKRRQDVNQLPHSKEKVEELRHLFEERQRIEHRIITLAFTYHGIRPEEDAISYPDGEIGRMAKQVGLVFGKPEE